MAQFNTVALLESRHLLMANHALMLGQSKTADLQTNPLNVEAAELLKMSGRINLCNRMSN